MSGHYGPEEWWYPDGTTAANVRAAVFLGDQSTLAAIFADAGLTVPLPNPTTTDGSGMLEFFAAEDEYWVFVGDENFGDSILADLNPPVTGTGGALLIANNLSDLSNVATARANLGLGNAAVRNIGTVAGTAAAGDDARFTTATYQGMSMPIGEALSVSISTGVIYGGEMSINADPSKVDITAVLGYIVDYHTDPTNPTFTRISLPAQIGVPMDAGSLARQNTYWMIDSTGTVIQTGTSPSRATRRSNLVIGATAQFGGSIALLTSVNDQLPQGQQQLMDLTRSLGSFLISGCTLSPNANLTYQMASGEVFATAVNETVDLADPHVVSTPAANPRDHRYLTRANPVPGALTTLVDPGNYDVADVVTPIPGSSNRATIQRLYYFPSTNTVAIQYGQNFYASLDLAVLALGSDPYVANPVLIDANSQGILLGALAVTKGCTDLSNTATARFFTFGKFSSSVATSGVVGAQQPFSLVPRADYSQIGGAIVVRSSKAVTLNAMYLTPFSLFSAATLTALAFELTSSTAGALVRIGFYTPSTALLPQTLITDLGTFTASAIGLRTITGLSQPLNSGAGWCAMVFQTAAPSVRHGAGWNPYVSSVNFPTGAGAGWNTAYVQTGVAGALPATVGAIVDTDAPVIGLKF